MLRELENIRQVPGESLRRWFEDDTLDLIVWFSSEGAIVGFQLCYGKGTQERALTWLRDCGFSHMRVDDGEGRPRKYKMTPILVPDGAFDKEEALRVLEGASGTIEPTIVQTICDIIRRYPKG
jgi:hypothetical protein